MKQELNITNCFLRVKIYIFGLNNVNSTIVERSEKYCYRCDMLSLKKKKAKKIKYAGGKWGIPKR